MNVDPNPTLELSTGGQIQYASGNMLEYKLKQERFEFTYFSSGKQLRLNDLVDESRWRIVAVRSPFRVTTADAQGILPKPNIEISIPGLERDERALLACFHEIGHAELYTKMHDQTPQRVKHKSFSEELVYVSNSVKETMTEATYLRMHERYAWAYALTRVRQTGVLRHFSNKELRSYYSPKLRSYGEDFVRSR